MVVAVLYSVLPVGAAATTRLRVHVSVKISRDIIVTVSKHAAELNCAVKHKPEAN